MPRRPKGPQMDIEDRENMGFAMGDARDWLDRSVVDITDWLEDVRTGELTFDELRGRITARFREGQQEMDNWHKWWGWRAQESGFPYLGEEFQEPLTFPLIRLVLPLPNPEQPA
jgi:hypothetical protein